MGDSSRLDVGFRSGALDRLRAALADRYLLESEIGRGGMSTVYLARDLRHSRPVAVKVLTPSLGTAAIERFTREIAVAARLQHPHILPLHDSGEAAGLLFYVMPYVEGESLRDRLERERRLPLDDALRIAGEVADALGYARAQGVVHRDVKPENILLSGYPTRPGAPGSWHALVTDFGIARALGGSASGRITSAGVVLGTPAYMSPEQAAGDHDVDGRSDIYSLACVLYEMLAGTPPFTGPNAQSVVARHIGDTPAPLRALRADVPERVEQAVARALEKVPAERYETAEELGRALRRRGSRVSLARAPGLGGGARRWVAALGVTAAVAAAAVALPRLGARLARAPALDASLFV
ncbi:MAG TPA: serine/threonine-protein kinase, partial [Gemmatimonadaceae bacterium]|nr:serine/threonine-protein kinase [Gemmatimonadaceae bacterium]